MQSWPKQLRQQPTLLLSGIYAPVGAYLYWFHFGDYSGSGCVSLILAAISLLAGYLDRRRPVVSCTLYLSCSALCPALVSLSLENRGHLREVPTLAFTVGMWFGIFLFVPTLCLVVIGRWLRNLRRDEIPTEDLTLFRRS